jgi:hypothetical protein
VHCFSDYGIFAVCPRFAAQVSQRSDGFYGERYRFKVFNGAGKEIFCVTLESDALEQPAWAKERPKEAAAGGRKFSLDGYASNSHSTYAYDDGEPPYEQVGEEAKQVLAGKKEGDLQNSVSGPSADRWRRIGRSPSQHSASNRLFKSGSKNHLQQGVAGY